MDKLLFFAIKSYVVLLRLYPSRYRQEFEEQMLLDFSDMATDSGKKGPYSLILFFLHELFDFPMGLLHAHWKENGLSRLFRSQPATMGLRSALGFGLGFAVVAIATWQISFWLFLTFDPWIQSWSVWYYDAFRSEQGMFLFQRALLLVSRTLTGLIFGLVFALLLGKRSEYLRYMLIGALGFLISDSVSFVLSEVFGWSFNLSVRQNYILNVYIFMFIGAVWGAICTLLDHSHRALLRFLAAGTIIYPLSTYIFIRLLFLFQLEAQPWLFVILMIFLLMLLSSVFVVVIKNNRGVPWIVITAAVGYPLLSYGLFYLTRDILPWPILGPSGEISREAFVTSQLINTAVEAAIGVIFGLILGLLWGYQRKNNQLLTATEH